MSLYPIIDQPTEDLDDQGLPYQRSDAPLAAFGGRTAQALGQAGDLLALGAEQYRRQLTQHQLLAHESAANDALNQYRLQGDALWRQFGGTRQRAAVEGHDAYQQGLQANRAQAQQGLSAASLALLRPALDQEHGDRVRLGETHRTVQDQAWSDQSSLDTLAVNKQAAVLHRDDPARVQRLALQGDGEWLKIGERRGWSDRRIGDQVRAWRGQVYGAVIDQQLHEGNIGGATALLTRVQGELDPPTADALGGRIVLADAKIQDQRNAPVVVPDAGSGVGVGGGAIDDGVGGDQPYGGGVQVAELPPDGTVMNDAGGTLPAMEENDSSSGANVQIAKGPRTQVPPITGKPKVPTTPQKPGHAAPSKAKTPPPAKQKWVDNPSPTQPIVGVSQEFSDAIADDEAHGKHSPTKSYLVTNWQSKPELGKDGKMHPVFLLDSNGNKVWNALGKYQLQDNALQTIKATGPKGRDDWNTNFGRAYGISSYVDFLENPAAQEAAFRLYMENQLDGLYKSGVAKWIGKTIESPNGKIVVTLAGLIAAAHRSGIGTLQAYFRNLQAHNWNSADISGINAKIRPFVRPAEQRLLNFANVSYFPNDVNVP